MFKSFPLLSAQYRTRCKPVCSDAVEQNSMESVSYDAQQNSCTVTGSNNLCFHVRQKQITAVMMKL